MAVIATDDFNRANGSLGSDWTVVSGWDSYVVASNVAAPPTVSANCYNLWTANTIANDQYAQVTIVACATANNDVGVGVLLRAIADASTRTFYSVYASNHGTFLSLYVSSVHTHLVDTNSITWSASDVLWMGIVGTVITLKKNGATVLTYDTASDATKLTSGRVGITYSSAADPGVGIDDFEAGDFSSGTSSATIDVASAPAQMSATGALRITATAAVAAAPASSAASGSVRITGTASLGARPARVAATGVVALSGAVTAQAPAATIAASASETIGAAVTVTAPAATVASVATERVAGTIAVTAPAARLSAASVTGGILRVRAPRAGLSATAALTIAGHVSGQATPASASLTGTLAINGSLAVTAPAARLRARSFTGEAPEAVYVANETTRQARVQIEAARRPAVGQERAFAAHLANETASRGRVEQETVMRAS